MKSVSVIGCGWLGQPLALELVREGYRVLGSTTSTSKVPYLEYEGLKMHVCDFGPGQSNDTGDLFQSDCVIITVPPDGKKRPGEDMEVHRTISRHLLTSRAHVIFCSSTSVYPDVNDELEEDDANESSAMYRRELLYKTLPSPVTIVRLGGLIGPGRHPVTFYSDDHLLKRPFSAVNMTTLEDAVAGIMHLAMGGYTGTFNLVHPHHPDRDDFYNYCAKRTGFDKPLFDLKDQFHGKRVSSKRITRLTGFEFMYKKLYDAVDQYVV